MIEILVLTSIFLLTLSVWLFVQVLKMQDRMSSHEWTLSDLNERLRQLEPPKRYDDDDMEGKDA